jgi:hypothetical protein
MPRQPVILAACMLFAVCSIAASQQPPLPPSVSAVLASEDNPFLADDPPPPIPSDVISAQTQQTAQTDGIEQQQPQAEAEQEGGEATDAAEAPQAAPTPTEPASNEDPCGCSTTGPDGNSTFAGCGQWLASQGSNAFVCYVNVRTIRENSLRVFSRLSFFFLTFFTFLLILRHGTCTNLNACLSVYIHRSTLASRS